MLNFKNFLIPIQFKPCNLSKNFNDLIIEIQFNLNIKNLVLI
jgi:hypothetical protein